MDPETSIGQLDNGTFYVIMPAVAAKPDQDMSTSRSCSGKEEIVWTDEWTKQLMHLYSRKINDVGPTKRFRRKNAMWIEIAEEISATQTCAVTGVQCENRFKTVKRRKMKDKIKGPYSPRASSLAYARWLRDLSHAQVATDNQTDANKSEPNNAAKLDQKLSTSRSCNGKDEIVWTDEWTNQLFHLYSGKINDVGKMNRFRSKMAMWNNIAEEISATHNCTVTGAQCANRYKTVKRRKIKETIEGTCSGASPMAYESEWEHIEEEDNSMIPEVMLSVDGCALTSTVPSTAGEGSVVCSSSNTLSPTRTPRTNENKQRSRSDGMVAALERANELKELSEARRAKEHVEKMSLMRALLKKLEKLDK